MKSVRFRVLVAATLISTSLICVVLAKPLTPKQRGRLNDCANEYPDNFSACLKIPNEVGGYKFSVEQCQKAANGIYESCVQSVGISSLEYPPRPKRPGSGLDSWLKSMLGGYGKVWVNTKTHIYYKEGSRSYGRTKHGKYLTEREAIRDGYIAANE